MTATPTEGGSEGTWAKLRRRKVVQWGLAYVAAAWGLLQGLEYVIRTFHWPEPVQQLTTLALLIGLPIVLVLAWYHGDRGEQRVRGTEADEVTRLLYLPVTMGAVGRQAEADEALPYWGALNSRLTLKRGWLAHVGDRARFGGI